MIDLGTLDSGPVSAATAINDSGQVVGFSITSSYRSIEAYLWEEGVGMSRLGTLGGNWSSAEDINNLGQIVGISSKAANVQDSYAVLWEGSVMSDLNSLIPEDSGWLLTNAQGINDAGQIVGAGYINDQFHAFLLTPVSETTPVPEPTSVFGVMVFGALGTGSVLKHRSKKRKSTSITTL
jgi:probable HAF family extracellular repeat protein